MPCKRHNLAWLEDRLLSLDDVLEGVMILKWSADLSYQKNDAYLQEQARWFSKRILLLCCRRDDFHNLEDVHKVRNRKTLGRHGNDDIVLARVKTTFAGNEHYLFYVTGCLADVSFAGTFVRHGYGMCLQRGNGYHNGATFRAHLQ
jgi:hypothetical protein